MPNVTCINDIEKASTDLIEAANKVMSLTGAFSFGYNMITKKIELQIQEDKFEEIFSGLQSKQKPHSRDRIKKAVEVGGVEFFALFPAEDGEQCLNCPYMKAG